MKKQWTSLALAFLLASAAGWGWTGPVAPLTVSYQGRIETGEGPMTPGVYEFTFAVFSASSGGALLWSETQDVWIDDGPYQVELGGGGAHSLLGPRKP